MPQYGSLFNSIYDHVEAPFEPEVGMGATMLYWSDRRAGTIIEVERFKTGKRAGQVKEITVQEDIARRTDSNGMSDAQNYAYERNPEGPTRRYNAGNDGTFKGLLIGQRKQYHDYSF